MFHYKTTETFGIIGFLKISHHLVWRTEYYVSEIGSVSALRWKYFRNTVIRPEYLTMDKVQKPSNTRRNEPSLESVEI
jgi:hypothetical protein